MTHPVRLSVGFGAVAASLIWLVTLPWHVGDKLTYLLLLIVGGVLLVGPSTVLGLRAQIRRASRGRSTGV